MLTCPSYLNYFWKESFSCIVSSYGFGVWLRIVRCSELQCEAFRRERLGYHRTARTTSMKSPLTYYFRTVLFIQKSNPTLSVNLERGFHIYNCQSLRNFRHKSWENEFRNPLRRKPKKYPNKILYIMIPIVDLDVLKLQMWRRLLAFPRVTQLSLYGNQDAICIHLRFKEHILFRAPNAVQIMNRKER